MGRFVKKEREREREVVLPSWRNFKQALFNLQIYIYIIFIICQVKERSINFIF